VPKTPYPRFYTDKQFPSFMRLLQVLNTFDRVQILVALNVPYGTASRWLATLESHGVIAKLPGVAGHYSKKAFKANKDVVVDVTNYGKGVTDAIVSDSYHKTAAWSAYITEWNAYNAGRAAKVKPVAAPPL